jgi:uncharacterized protein (DUF885 family)
VATSIASSRRFARGWLRALACASALAGTAACQSTPPPSAPVAGSGDAAFTALAASILKDGFKRHPTNATNLGIHTFDGVMDDGSAAGVGEETAALGAFRARLADIDAATLSPDKQLDREQLIHAMDAGILANSVLRQWQRDPDFYSGGVTKAAHAIMKRKFAPPADRLKALIERERNMPAFLDEGRKNLDNPPRVFTEIAIEQIDGNINFFKNDVPAAFAEVADKSLLADFARVNANVMAALSSYKTFLRKVLLPKSNGSFALGAETYAKALSANEMIDLSIEDLSKIAEANRRQNEAAFQEAARAIDATRPADAVLAALQHDHPAPSALLKSSQDALDAIRQFIIDRQIVTIPPSAPATVQETPPFMRSTTSASMDTPGPFETAPLAAFYHMTLPDPRATPAAQDDYMKSWYYAQLANVSVHEVYPGHYIQFLYAKRFPSDVRKVYGASTNVEGWAHYSEQMMIDEGFHADDPSYRLAQLQDALLRNVRFIVGIAMHTKGMTTEEATKLFETQGHQPHALSVQEAKRGAGDPLYGYYTMGKLMILKLRDDYKKKMGAAYSLQKFHDAFIQLGPLPLPLVRKAMLGEAAAATSLF